MVEPSNIDAEMAERIREAVAWAEQGRVCTPEIMPPLTSVGDRLEATWDAHCRSLTGRPKGNQAHRPDPLAFASKLTMPQRAYVMALKRQSLNRWGLAVRQVLLAGNDA